MSMRFAVIGMVAVACAMVALPVVAQDAAAKKLPLAEARAQIGDAIKSPDKLTAIMKSLSAEDQVSFLADVNVAISKSPDLGEGKVAAALNANRAALKGAAKGNLPALLAEVFATATPEALSVINERFARDVFNRSNEKRTYTDEQFTRIAEGAMAKIQQRTAGSDEAAVRNVFAILMFVRASNGTPVDLADKLVAGLPEGSPRDLAKNEWIPSALGVNGEKTYEPMLGYAEAGDQPNVEVVISIAGPQLLDAMLIDLATSMKGGDGKPLFDFSDNALGLNNNLIGEDQGLGRVQRTLDPTLPWNPSNKRQESSGYQWQNP